MSQVEDPSATVARLLRSKMRVVKDNGSLASVNVSYEWQSSDALKSCDGQVTVGLAEETDQKIDLSGKIRRRTSSMRVNVWATDMPNATEDGKSIRNKIMEEVNRVIRQNRTIPNITVYDFVGLGVGGQGHRAFSGDTEAVPTDSWAELSVSDYEGLWYSDDNPCSVSSFGAGKCAVLLFRFKIESHRNAIKQAVLSFEGYGTSPGGNGVTIKAYNYAAGAWQNAQTNQEGTADAVLTLTADLPQFLDGTNFLWLLAKTSYPSDGVTPAVLNCDYVSATVTVNGITYCDVTGARNLDRVDVKPPIYRTEIAVKSWHIENIGV